MYVFDVPGAVVAASPSAAVGSAAAASAAESLPKVAYSVSRSAAVHTGRQEMRDTLGSFWMLLKFVSTVVPVYLNPIVKVNLEVSKGTA